MRSALTGSREFAATGKKQPARPRKPIIHKNPQKGDREAPRPPRGAVCSGPQNPLRPEFCPQSSIRRQPFARQHVKSLPAFCAIDAAPEIGYITKRTNTVTNPQSFIPGQLNTPCFRVFLLREPCFPHSCACVWSCVRFRRPILRLRASPAPLGPAPGWPRPHRKPRVLRLRFRPEKPCARNFCVCSMR